MMNHCRRDLQNAYFLCSTFVTGVFYLCFYTVSLVLGLALAFTLAGIPLLMYVLRISITFIQYERIQTKIYTDITIEPYVVDPVIGDSMWENVRGQLVNRRNWLVILWLIFKAVIGIAALLAISLCYLLPLICVTTPLWLYLLDHLLVEELAEAWSKSFLVMGIGGVLGLAGSWLGNRFTYLAGCYTRSMIRSINRLL